MPYLQRFAVLLLLIGVAATAVSSSLVRAAGSGGQSWANPSAASVQRVGNLPATQHESVTFGNIDCNQLSYRLTTSNAMLTGCFMQTSLGLMNIDNDMLIFNGTDEAVSVVPYVGGSILVSVPQSQTMINLLPLSVDGMHVALYRNPVASMKHQQNLAGQVSGENLSTTPEVTLSNAAGAALAVDPSSIAFSRNGQWLIVEEVAGSFVRINLDTLEETAFAPSFSGLVGLTALHSQVAISDDGQFVAVNNDSVGTFKVYDLGGCLSMPCIARDYRPLLTQQVSGLQRIRHVRFINDSLLSFEGISSVPSSSGVYELTPNGQFGPLIDYLGLGDSYTSGEGAFDYLSGTDSDANTCHLSARSYPLLLSDDAFGENGHSVACSGAVINDVGSLSNGYRGQAKNTLPASQVLANFSPGYLGQHRFVQQYQPRIVTVSVGGNDIGFGDILQQCVAPHVSLNPTSNTCFSTYEDRMEVMNLIDRTVPRWTALYKQLRDESPGSQLFAIGYPQIAVADGSCGLNVHLNRGERTFAAQLIDYLDLQIRSAALAANITYLDISHALDGHRLCETSSDQIAMNGLTAGTDFGAGNIKLLGRESYHPNMLGQRLIEQSILRQTRNFRGVTTTNDDSNPSSTLLDAPKSSRPILALEPVNGMAAALATRGLPFAVHLDGALYGLMPNSQYRVQIDTVNIGSVPTNSDGTISASVTVPNNAVVGGHLLSIQGRNQLQEMVSVYEPFYVQYAATDADGDHITDNFDTCPSNINSGTDADNDGVDDACDSFIGSPEDPASDNSSGSFPIIDGSARLTVEPPVLHGNAGFELHSSSNSEEIRQQAAVHKLQQTFMPQETEVYEGSPQIVPHVLGSQITVHRTTWASTKNRAKQELELLLFALVLLLAARQYARFKVAKGRCKT